MPRGIGGAILLVAACWAQAQASTCLKETAPEVASHLVAGDPDRIRQAIADLEKWAGQTDTPQAAPWLAAQASMLLDLGAADEAEERLRRAVSGWMAAGNRPAEICARRLLVFALTLRSEPRLALSETMLAESRAHEAGLDTALNSLKRTRVTLLLTLNERLEEALVLMDELRPGDTPGERINGHHIRGLMLGRLKRHREAAAQFEQVLEQARSESLHAMAATARLNLATQLAQLGRDHPLEVPENRVVELLEHVVSDRRARAATRALALRSLAQFRPPEERAELLGDCVQAAEQANDDRRKAVCLADLAELEVAAEPARALDRLARAVALADSDPRALWQIQAQRLAVIWATEPPLEAFESSLQAIDGERRLRELQMTGPERARLIDGLSWDHRRLADRAFAHVDTHPELAARAFELLEANRALVLRELRHSRRDPANDESTTDLAGRINQAQKALLSTDANTGERERAGRELERLEAAWREATVHPPELAPRPVQSPQLKQIRDALKSDEALLSFLTLVPGQPPGGTGWLQVISETESRLYPVPLHYDLITAAELLHGLPDWHKAPARQLLDRLGKRLLRPALADLGPDINHLVVIPDRGIERLPLESLPGADDQPVGVHYSMDMAPSAGVWLSAREARRGSGQVLALADPTLPAAGYQALDAAFPGGRPAGLPGAAREVRQLHRLGGTNTVRLRTGNEASESALTSSGAMAEFGLVHFATHALIHPDRPERSALLLAADEHGDGLLQPREIERMALDDTAVVLASCSSATGEQLDNEGVISLARSFLVAGAISVVATRWPVEDGHAQVFFQRFYRHLADGRDQSDAMRRARAELRDGGYPDRAWAAYVLYGDGRWQPLTARPSWPAWALLALAAALTALLIRRTA